MQLIDLMFNFAYMLAGGSEFWAGFWFCMQWLLLIWLGNLFLRAIDVRWKKVRQYFAPTKKPSKAKEEPEPSPAQQGVSCLINLLTVGFLVLVAVVILLQLFAPDLAPW